MKPGSGGSPAAEAAASAHAWQAAVWTTVLAVGFLTLVGLARAGSILFWHVDERAPGTGGGASASLLASVLLLLAASVAMSAFAAPLQRYTAAAAEQIQDRAAYARAVLGERTATEGSTRPYRFPVPAPQEAPR